MKFLHYIFVFFILFLSFKIAANGLLWPVACDPKTDCVDIGLPDIDNDGIAYNCQPPGYFGHQGTDITINYGTDVYASETGEVLFVFDGKDDNCPSSSDDCQPPPDGWFVAGESNGYRVCTESGSYCGTGASVGQCFLCFDGGNVVVIKHENNNNVFATRYDHFKKNSIIVMPGEMVVKGQKIGEVGSAGSSTGAHLHFEVWGTGFYELAEPWAGSCGPNYNDSLWSLDAGGYPAHDRPAKGSEVQTSPTERDSNHVTFYLLQISDALNTDASVDYITSDGSAIAGQDYITTSGVAIIKKGETNTIIGIEIIGDTITENNEDFFLTISNPQGASFPEGITEIVVSKTIVDDD